MFGAVVVSLLVLIKVVIADDEARRPLMCGLFIITDETGENEERMKREKRRKRRHQAVIIEFESAFFRHYLPIHIHIVARLTVGLR